MAQQQVRDRQGNCIGYLTEVNCSAYHRTTVGDKNNNNKAYYDHRANATFSMTGNRLFEGNMLARFLQN